MTGHAPLTNRIVHIGDRGFGESKRGASLLGHDRCGRQHQRNVSSDKTDLSHRRGREEETSLSCLAGSNGVRVGKLGSESFEFEMPGIEQVLDIQPTLTPISDSDPNSRSALAPPETPERVTRVGIATLEPTAEPLDPLRRRPVRESVRTNGPGRLRLNAVVTHRGCGAEPFFDVALLQQLALTRGVAPHTRETVGLVRRGRRVSWLCGDGN